MEQEDIGRMNFRFPPAPHSGKISLSLKNIGKDYDDLTVLEKVDLEVIKGDKLAFVGKNGEGKSTLAKIIVNELEYTGDIELGHQIKVGYYAQNQAEFLDETKTVLETIYDAADEKTSPKVRSILGSFLFSNDTVEKKVGILSGGERARVALCKLLLEPVNLLVMDEPTNHLDITSKELLKRALLEYDGSLVVVSHDREFLQGLTEKVYEFKERNIKEYLGDINDFLKEKDLENFKELETSQAKQKQKESKGDSDHKISYKEKKDSEKREKKLNNKIRKFEKEIDSLEKEIKEIDSDLAIPERFKELSEDPDFFNNYEQKQLKLKEIEQFWEKANLELDTLK